MDAIEVKNSPYSEVGDPNKTTFKKPILIGKIGSLPRKMLSSTTKSTPTCTIEDEINQKNKEIVSQNVQDTVTNIVHNSETVSKSEGKPLQLPTEQLFEIARSLPYKEPSWSGLPPHTSKEYTFEVLKSGVIVEQINLMKKAFWVFGRSVTCDIHMAHPTISRYHAVLQYRVVGTEKDKPGFYIYDLNSTHGTFLNKGKLKSKVYAPVKVGHLLKLGFSTRSYVLSGPDEDKEEESALSLTELKRQRAEKILKEELDLKQALIKEEQEKEERRKRYEQRGVDWGLGEDADEEADISENPFAQTNNEELYIDDPKKALRGFMEREGHSLDYDCTEQGFGQFLCKVELPLDDDQGHRIVAEVLHKGKKKEAVVQCALEACRILDRYGVLRQATHESRKRKDRNWEENDYYDSDEDTFLDRTGAIEKKREKRMNAKVPQQPETYQSLLEKEKSISSQIAHIEKQLAAAKKKTTASEGNDEDSLDVFMKGLKESKLDKQMIRKLKSDLVALKTEHVNIVKLVNLVKPADLPPLVLQYEQSAEDTKTSSVSKAKLPLFGKHIKVDIPQNSMTKVMDKGINKNEEDDDIPSPRPQSAATDAIENTQESKSNANAPACLNIYQKVSEAEAFLHTNSLSSTVTQDCECDQIQNSEDLDDGENPLSAEELEKRKRKNQKRNQHRKEKSEIEKQRGYKEDAQKEDYNMWIPPENQSGDGRTKLNEKYGY